MKWTVSPLFCQILLLNIQFCTLFLFLEFGVYTVKAFFLHLHHGYVLLSYTIIFCSFLSSICTGVPRKNKRAAIQNYSIQSTHESDQPKRNPRRRRDDNLEIYERRQSRKEENKNLKKNIVVLYNLVKPEESIKSNILIMFFIFCFILLGFKQFHK